LSNVGVGIAFVFLAFAGYETVFVLGEEAKDPKPLYQRESSLLHYLQE